MNNNSKYLFILILFGSLLASPNVSSAQTAMEIMNKYKEEDHSGDSRADLKMLLINSSGKERVRKVTQMTKTDKNGLRKSLIRFLSPADVKGTGLLQIENKGRDDDNWLYLPALRKVRRISGGSKTDRFMGSDFTYEDLEPEDLEDHTYKLLGSETRDGGEAWKIEALPKESVSDKTGYSKRILWITKDHYQMVKVKFFNKDGAYSKELIGGGIRKIEGADKWRTFRIEMQNVLKGTKTVLDITDYKLNTGIKDKIFTRRYLKKGK